MRIAVVAAGGLGGYLGARLAQSGEEGHLVARGAPLAKMREVGRRGRSVLGDFVLPAQAIRATGDPTAIGPAFGAWFKETINGYSYGHTPGLTIVCPATARDAKGLIKAAIRDDNPVVFFEDKMMYKLKGPVPSDEYTIPFGVADVKRRGEDITLVATSSMVQIAIGAAEKLSQIGVSAEIIDPRTTKPLDKQALVDSAKKTSRAIVLDEGYECYGVTAEIASVIADGAFYYLDAPVKRMGAMDVPIPFSPVLEDLTVPTEEAVFEMAKSLCGRL